MPMPSFSRRALLAATAASLAARGLPAFAAPAPHSFKHGAFEVTVVSDGHLVLPVSFLARGAPPAERAALLQAAGETGEQYHSPTNVTLIRTANDLFLVDMGSGDRFMPSAGRLWDNLKSAGIDKAKITKVIFTHGHPDHLWGAVDEFDDLMLPQAAFYVAAAEWDVGTGDNARRGLPAERAGFVTGALGRQATQRIVAGPEIPFGGGDVEGGLRQHEVVELVHRAPEMVRVAVGEDHLGDLGLVDAGAFEIVPQFAGARHEAVAGAHVYQDQVVGGADQRDIGRRIVLLAGLAGRLQQRRAFRRRRAGRQKAHRQHQMAVAHHRQLKGAVLEAMGRGRRKGRQAARGQAGGGGGEQRAAAEGWHRHSAFYAKAGPPAIGLQPILA